MAETLLQLIRTEGTAKSRHEAIDEVASMLLEANAITPAYRDAMFARESSVSTFMGNLLAIPHGTIDSIDQVLTSALAIVRYESPIDWDGEEVRFVIGIAGREGVHLEALSSIALVFSDLETVDQLLNAQTSEEISRIFKTAEQA